MKKSYIFLFFEYYSYFMPVCSIVQTITSRCRGQPEALLHEVEGRVNSASGRPRCRGVLV